MIGLKPNERTRPRVRHAPSFTTHIGLYVDADHGSNAHDSVC